jgi:oxygen-independent coproporphyrinogen-3 oxidase
MEHSNFPEPRAAYIHVPFCAHRCGYCDFTLVARRDDLVGAYLDALELELASLGEPRQIETLFLGGGTPTHLPADGLRRLLQLLKKWFRLQPEYEFSCEANPAGFTIEKMELLAEGGVNRISLGAQSFDAAVLQTLERDHDATQITDVINSLRPFCRNIGVDLIFGVPGQSLALWQETLQRAIQLSVQHVSTYGLTFEKGTAFWTRRSHGALQSISEDLEREMYAAAMDKLPAAGFQQYELSNFARPGFSCRHNGVYWAGDSYYGFGPGAARYLAGRRETNHRSVTTWIKRVLARESPVGNAEELAPEDRARELLVLGLRRAEGINRAQFRARTGFEVELLAGERLAIYRREQLVEDFGDWIRLTRAGRFVADAIVVDCL